MEKKKKGKAEIEVADGVELASSAKGGPDFLDANQKKQQNKRTRNDMDRDKTEGKKMRKSLQIENYVTSSSRCIEKSPCMEEAAEQGKKKRNNHDRSIENDSPAEPPSNNFTPDRNASGVTAHDIESESHSGSPSDEVLSSVVGREKRRKKEKRDTSMERNKETEKPEGTKFLTCSLLGKGLISQLPDNSCLRDYSEVNYNAPGVRLSGDMSEAEKLCEKHDLAESIETRQDLEAMCSAPCSAAESDGKPVSEHDDHALVANSTESEILLEYERRKPIKTYNSQRKTVSDPPAVNSKSTLDNRSLLLENGMENLSLVQSVETLPSVCSKHVNEKELDEADVRIPTLLELCTSRDEIAQKNVVDFLPTKGSLTGSFKKKLLVLDINGLLADIVYHVLDGYTPDAIISGKSVFKRPFCDDFLEFCFARFNVGVWSSRTKKNVELILDFLMGSTKNRLLFCWDQSHCTDSNLTTVENRKKPLLVKKLKKLWEKYEPDLPWELEEYNESNTLLLDDSPYKAVCNPPCTAVFPPSYRYTDKEDNSLGPGGELRVYLERLAMADNVQKYVEENPMGERPITEKNPSWSFYLEVIRVCSSPEN